jgi:hypothetical protein
MLPQPKHKRMHYAISTKAQEDALCYLNQKTLGYTIPPQPKHNRMHYRCTILPQPKYKRMNYTTLTYSTSSCLLIEVV